MRAEVTYSSTRLLRRRRHIVAWKPAQVLDCFFFFSLHECTRKKVIYLLFDQLRAEQFFSFSELRLCVFNAFFLFIFFKKFFFERKPEIWQTSASLLYTATSCCYVTLFRHLHRSASADATPVAGVIKTKLKYEWHIPKKDIYIHILTYSQSYACALCTELHIIVSIYICINLTTSCRRCCVVPQSWCATIPNACPSRIGTKNKNKTKSIRALRCCIQPVTNLHAILTIVPTCMVYHYRIFLIHVVFRPTFYILMSSHAFLSHLDDYGNVLHNVL